MENGDEETTQKLLRLKILWVKAVLVDFFDLLLLKKDLFWFNNLHTENENANNIHFKAFLVIIVRPLGLCLPG